ncbi:MULTISPECIES: hypothetical protein [Brevibacterium]|uniref:hypothetical protein n=1 Tax=Brevibacterium TaxID=1696 RepID=UPI001BAC9B80|nr:hypothetical protein [Brevibacterium sp. W7.2]
MTRRRDVGPERIRSYRIEAEPRPEPDLHQLARLFIGMAQARARDAHTTDTAAAAEQPPAPRLGAASRDGNEAAR